MARRQLRRLGLSDDEIDGRLRRGSLLRLHRGVFAVGHSSLTIEGRWMAAVLAGGSGAVLSHRAAGQLWRILPRTPILPEITRPGTFKPRAGIVQHRAQLPADERRVLNDIPVTSVPRVLLDLAADLVPRQLERAWNEMEVRQLTDPLSVPDLFARHPRRRGSVVLRRIAEGDRVDGVTRNDFEELFLALVDTHGLPRPRLNADLHLRGRFFEIDALWTRARLAVELDSRSVHATRRAFEADRERDRLLLVEGWRVTRITWRSLRDEPDQVAADLAALLETT